MPVLIAAPPSELDLVRSLALRLLSEGGEVRCYLEEHDHELKGAGCKLAVGPLADASNLEAALTNVHTFIPLFHDPLSLTSREALAELSAFGAAAPAAAGGSAIAQTIVPIPAVAEDGGPVAAAYGRIRAEMQAACRPLCVILTGVMTGEARPASRPGLPAVPRTRVDALAALLASADDREDLHGVWEFAAPESGSARSAAAGPGMPDGLARMLETWPGVGDSATREFGVPPG